MEAIGAALLVPEFGPDDLGSSDWNDYAGRRGRESVRRLAMAAVREAGNGRLNDACRPSAWTR